MRSVAMLAAFAIVAAAVGCNGLLDIGDAFFVGSDASADRDGVVDGGGISPSAVSIGPFAEIKATRGKVVDLPVSIAGDRGIYGRLTLRLTTSADAIAAKDVSVEPGQTTAVLRIVLGAYENVSDPRAAPIGPTTARVELLDGERVLVSSEVRLVVDPRSGDVELYGELPSGGNECDDVIIADHHGLSASLAYGLAGESSWALLLHVIGRGTKADVVLRSGMYPDPSPLSSLRGGPSAPSVTVFDAADGGSALTIHRFLPDGGPSAGFGDGGVVSGVVIPDNGLDYGIHAVPNGLATWVTNGNAAVRVAPSGAVETTATMGYDRKRCAATTNGDLVCVARDSSNGAPRFVRVAGAGGGGVSVTDVPLAGAEAFTTSFEPLSVARLDDGTVGAVVRRDTTGDQGVARIDVATSTATATMILQDTYPPAAMRGDGSVLAVVFDTTTFTVHVQRRVFGAAAPALDVVPLLPGGNSIRGIRSGQNDEIFLVTGFAPLCAIYRMYP